MNTNCTLTPLTPDQRAMAEDPAIVKYVRRMVEVVASNWPGREIEVESAVFYGLVVATATYDPARGWAFRSWVAHKIRYVVIDCMRAENHYRRKKAAGFVDVQYPVDDNGDYLDLPSGEDEVGWALHSVEGVEELIKPLGDKQRQVVRLFFLHGLPQQDIAPRVGVSRGRVSQILTESLAAMREAVECRMVS